MSLRRAAILIIALLLLAPAAPPASAQPNWEMSNARDIDNILPVRKQVDVFNEILAWRLDNLLPRLMRQEGLDMWLVICFEYAEDPVYMTLVARPSMSARRLSILLFHDAPDGFKKLTANWHGASTSGPMYTSLFTQEYRSKLGANGQLAAVADYIRKTKPKRIGINTAEPRDYIDDFSHGLGLTAFFKERLEQALDPADRARLTSAESLSVAWLETRSPLEMSLYRHLAGIGHDLIGEFFSNRVIVPDVTTASDVRWWYRERIARLGLEAWFQPSIDIRRAPEEAARHPKSDEVIRRGDLLHCDIGFRYLGLAIDMQHNAYVLRPGETEAPAGLQQLLRKGNRLQEILMAEMKEGRTGNQILVSALERAKAEGIEGAVYSHPIGFYGHGSGTTIGMTEKQSFVPGTGDRPLHLDTAFAIELNVSAAVPEWGDARVTMGLEDDALFTRAGARWVDGYPTALYLIR